jgi:hypothetical protein
VQAFPVDNAQRMHITHQQDYFSRAVVQAVAAAAAVGADIPPYDQNSKDIHFEVADTETDAGPQLDAQLKCVTTVDVSGDEFSYDLDVKNYTDLIKLITYVPRILIVVVVPPDPVDWLLAVSPETITLKRCAYWVSLRGQPPTTNTSTIAVKIPTSQVFDVAGLLGNLQPPGASL